MQAPAPPAHGSLSINQAQEESLRAKHLAVVLVLMRCPSKWPQIRQSVEKPSPIEPATAVGDLVAQMMSGRDLLRQEDDQGFSSASGGRALLGVGRRAKQALIASNAIGPITMNDMADAQEAGQTTDLPG